MASLSTLIACFGLLANSAAVVIGAMLVAPLMGPIFGVALALTMGDRQLFRRALVAELVGGTIVIALSVLIGFVAMRQDFGSQILSRTERTLYDLVVAVASGLVGAYAVVDQRISPALPGVAIATTLAPPLATSGICLSGGHWDLALGAFLLFIGNFLLFIGNFLSIELASAGVFLSLGVAVPGEEGVGDVRRLLRKFGLSLVVLAAIGTVMTRSLVVLVERARTSREIRSVLNEEFRALPGAQLTEVSQKREEGRLRVTGVVLTPSAIEPEQIRRIQARLRGEVDPSTRLLPELRGLATPALVVRSEGDSVSMLGEVAVPELLFRGRPQAATVEESGDVASSIGGQRRSDSASSPSTRG